MIEPEDEEKDEKEEYVVQQAWRI